jgi:hypothetical protein
VSNWAARAAPDGYDAHCGCQLRHQSQSFDGVPLRSILGFSAVTIAATTAPTVLTVHPSVARKWTVGVGDQGRSGSFSYASPKLERRHAQAKLFGWHFSSIWCMCRSTAAKPGHGVDRIDHTPLSFGACRPRCSGRKLKALAIL